MHKVFPLLLGWFKNHRWHGRTFWLLGFAVSHSPLALCDMACAPVQPPGANGDERAFILGGWKSLRLMLRRLVVATCNGGGGGVNPGEKSQTSTKCVGAFEPPY